jgi:uncharacterized alpha-E superfamily protein
MLSRVASTLYWMSRYVERAENTARVLDVAWRMSLLVKEPDLQDQEWFAPLNITGTLFPFAGRHNEVCAREVLHFMALDHENPSSIFSCAKHARENARAVRGAITSEMWEVLNSTWLEMQHMDEEKMHARGVSAFFDWVKERSHLFRGVTFGTLHRDDAYEFARLGTHMERADSTARILDVKYHLLLPGESSGVGGMLDYYQWTSVLRAVSAVRSYQWVYREEVHPWNVAELLMLRSEMPRSLRSCYDTITGCLDELSKIHGGKRGECHRLAGAIASKLRFGRIEDIFQAGLHEHLTEHIEQTSLLGDQIANLYMR